MAGVFFIYTFFNFYNILITATLVVLIFVLLKLVDKICSQLRLSFDFSIFSPRHI